MISLGISKCLSLVWVSIDRKVGKSRVRVGKSRTKVGKNRTKVDKSITNQN